MLQCKRLNFSGLIKPTIILKSQLSGKTLLIYDKFMGHLFLLISRPSCKAKTKETKITHNGEELRLISIGNKAQTTKPQLLMFLSRLQSTYFDYLRNINPDMN